MFVRPALMAAAAVLLLSSLPPGGGYHRLTVYLRGRAQSVRVYDPPADEPRRPVQVLVVSGDLGWLGIGEFVPGHLQAQGYRVVALNAQSYVAAFTGHGRRLTAADIAHDFDVVMRAASVDSVYPDTFIVVGVSEGSGLAVMAAGQPGASELGRGIIALALPLNTALGWRWTDFPSWITKAEPHEPLAPNREFVAQLRVPLVVLHSLHDEYDPIERVQELVSADPAPHRFIPVDAPNHRFSHRTRQVLALVDGSLLWIQQMWRGEAAAAR